MHIAFKIDVNWLLMSLVRLPANTRLLVVKFWRSQFIHGFSTAWGSAVLTALFKGHLYQIIKLSLSGEGM